MKKNSRPGLKWFAAALFVLAAAAAVWAFTTLEFDASVEGTAHRIRDWGMWGVAGSIACANGMVYGSWWGGVITWVGAMLGASFAFALVRALGRPFVERMVPAKQWEQISLWSDDRGAAVLLVARLVPVIAFNLINYVAALTGISWWTFLWATGLGILPLTILLSILGDRMLSMPQWAWLALGVLAIAAWVVMHRWRPPVRRADEAKP